MGFKKAVFVFMFVCATTLSASANSSCRSKVNPWVETDGSITMALRSNACHYWTWAKAHAGDYLSKDLLKYEALITGDPHHENFSHIFSGGQRIYVLNDIDDVGYGPVLLDLVKFMGVSAWSDGEHQEKLVHELLQSFKEGLQSRYLTSDQISGFKVPEMLLEDFAVTASDFQDDYQKKIKKDTKGDNIDDGKGVIRYKDLSGAQKRTFDDLEKHLFAKSLPKGFKVLDRANSVKIEGGGSVGLVRYLYLLENKDHEQHLLEFKPIESTSLDIYKQSQKEPEARAREALSIYWPSGYPDVFKIVGEGDDVFFMRPKYKKYVDYSTGDFKRDFAEFLELSKFIAFHLGQKQGLQLHNVSDMLHRLETDSETLETQISALLTSYLRIVELEHDRGKK